MMDNSQSNFSLASPPDMILFDPKQGLSFIKRVFHALILWGLAIDAAHAIFKYAFNGEPEITWALTVATGLAIFFLMATICMWRQAIYVTRINECAAAKKRLEEAILKNRISSKRK